MIYSLRNLKLNKEKDVIPKDDIVHLFVDFLVKITGIYVSHHQLTIIVARGMYNIEKRKVPTSSDIDIYIGLQKAILST